MNKKRNLVIAFIFLLLLLVFAWFATSLINDKGQELAEQFKNPIVHQEGEVEKMLAANQEVLASSNREAQPIDGITEGDNVLGSLESPVQVIVYEDLADKYSANFSETVKKLFNDYKDKVVVAFRPFIVGTNEISLPVAEAIACASEQEKFSEMRELIIEKVKSGQIVVNDLVNYAEELKLNVKKFESCLEDNVQSSKIDAQTDQAKNYSVYGAPTIFIDKEIVVGARAYDDSQSNNGDKLEGLKTIVDRHLKTK